MKLPASLPAPPRRRLTAILLAAWGSLAPPSQGLAADAPAATMPPAGRAAAWKSSVAGRLWHGEPPLAAAPADAAGTFDVTVDPAAVRQTMDGWGGCFNERGWQALTVLDPAGRERVMRALFDPADGLKLNLCRSPIGASDYALAPYSLDDAPGDYAMTYFSIARDQKLLIPFIKAAALRPQLQVWGVPWSPPAWMKTNGLFNTDHDGHLKSDARRCGPVEPGARRVEAQGAYGDRLAFRNPDGGLVLVMQNRGDEPRSAAVNLGGWKITPILAPHSWNTFTLPAR